MSVAQAGPPVDGGARVHITGASGCGVSTLGEALARRLGVAWFDTDEWFWQPSDPPFQTPRPMPERLERLAGALDDRAGWVLSGSLDGWGDALAGRFRMVVFVSAPPALRMARLRAREAARYGARLLPGGDMHAASAAFLDWAAGYDAGGMEMRSRARHEAWLAALPCPVLRLDGAAPAAEVLARALAGLRDG